MANNTNKSPNRMTALLNKIERRLGLKVLKLPEELSKDSWADIIKEDTLPTFSRYFPNQITVIIDNTCCKDGFYFIDKDILEADDLGIIHIHDKDYIAQKMYNCCLINMDDMLQNGTVISGSFIDKPHSFTTAANVATQIMAQVASSTFGGQTINVHHISKFVNEFRQRYIKRLQKRNEELGLQITQEQFDKMVEMSVADEIEKGVQMIQYQINTLQTTNG